MVGGRTLCSNKGARTAARGSDCNPFRFGGGPVAPKLFRRVLQSAALAACVLGGMQSAAFAQVSIGVGVAVPGVRIGISVPAYPDLVPVPGFPVYYAPDLDVNLFFYNGFYWTFTNDAWYSSTWYNGPWYLVPPERVPDFILRVPVGFYRRPPPYFLHWNRNEPPRWAQHWGPRWRRNRPDWDRRNRGAPPSRAPLPRYQRGYPQQRYPGPGEQRRLENRYYRFPQHPDSQGRGRPGPQPRYPQRPHRQQPQQREHQPRRGDHPPV